MNITKVKSDLFVPNNDANIQNKLLFLGTIFKFYCDKKKEFFGEDFSIDFDLDCNYEPIPALVSVDDDTNQRPVIGCRAPTVTNHNKSRMPTKKDEEGFNLADFFNERIANAGSNNKNVKVEVESVTSSDGSESDTESDYEFEGSEDTEKVNKQIALSLIKIKNARSSRGFDITDKRNIMSVAIMEEESRGSSEADTSDPNDDADIEDNNKYDIDETNNMQDIDVDRIVGNSDTNQIVNQTTNQTINQTTSQAMQNILYYKSIGRRSGSYDSDSSASTNQWSNDATQDRGEFSRLIPPDQINVNTDWDTFESYDL